MKRAALFFFLFLAVPAVILANGVTRRMIVGTRLPALNALQALRSDEFDPTNRVRYNVMAFRHIRSETSALNAAGRSHSAISVGKCIGAMASSAGRI